MSIIKTLSGTCAALTVVMTINGEALAGPQWTAVPGGGEFFSAVGGYVAITKRNDSAYVEVVLNKKATLDNFQSIVDSGAFAGDLASAAAATTPMYRCFYTAEQGVAFSAVELFQTTNVASAHFIAELVLPNAYGHDTYVKVFSFDMDRATFNNIDWKNFNPRNFSKVTANFIMPTWYYANVINERQGYPLSPP